MARHAPDFLLVPLLVTGRFSRDASRVTRIRCAARRRTSLRRKSPPYAYRVVRRHDHHAAA